MLRMDAQQWKPVRRSWMARVAFGALVMIVVLCLWQGYGMWLLGRVGVHAG